MLDDGSIRIREVQNLTDPDPEHCVEVHLLFIHIVLEIGNNVLLIQLGMNTSYRER